MSSSLLAGMQSMKRGRGILWGGEQNGLPTSRWAATAQHPMRRCRTTAHENTMLRERSAELSGYATLTRPTT